MRSGKHMSNLGHNDKLINGCAGNVSGGVTAASVAGSVFAFALLLCVFFLVNANLAVGDERIEVMSMNSGPAAPVGVTSQIVNVDSQTAVMLGNVPTSFWTYGCSATSARMMFRYYDRSGYSNMYTGPANGGVAPLSNLGQGDNPASPRAGSCSIIATQQGFDGRGAATPGHVDDYWTGYGNAGPDPWEGVRAEHAWGGCTADYMGTNQWKWDFIDSDGVKDFNNDGGTALFSYNNADKLYDYIPPAGAGLPQTEVCHGMRLFAESRGYEVLENYTQKIDTLFAGGFSFNDYMAEINAGYPVMIQVTGHTMVGVGYDVGNMVYLHDTWGDYTASMTWGGAYSGMDQQAVTVMHLAPVPEPAMAVLLLLTGTILLRSRRRR